VADAGVDSLRQILQMGSAMQGQGLGGLGAMGGLGALSGLNPNTPATTATQPPNPALLQSLFPNPSPQPDTRPPEERFQEQLRQLNDMGFYDPAKNVRALTMSGGNVEGAIEVLLSQL